MPPRKYVQFPTLLTDEDVDAMIRDARLLAQARRIERNRRRALGLAVDEFPLGDDTPTPDVFGYDDFVEGE